MADLISREEALKALEIGLADAPLYVQATAMQCVAETPAAGEGVTKHKTTKKNWGSNSEEKLKLYIGAEDMPRSCTECFLGERYGCVGDVKCHALREYFTGNAEPPYKERPDECPLTELTEKHGHWQGEGDGYADGEIVYDVWECSECGYTIDDGTDDVTLLPNFCPNCGTRMDGGDSDVLHPEEDGRIYEREAGGEGVEPLADKH